ncbi:GNAT family N-acetyltransferase [Streptomyces sp. NBC_01104]|uniref:GNAT family N-acetyltransferase n=1 Tax=Streptomyces sp. NBC_01104 TaxID=2903750 RepID=UPI003868CE6F|nr:GNAT family N-acetyltransferase [Streptomyces sp. NBC_01104]
MPTFEITTASSDDIRMMADWAHAEGWNPGLTDGQAFFAADPRGFLVGRLDGAPASCVSVVRYGSGSGFLGFYLTRPELRGQGYGSRLWATGTARLAGRNTGLDGVVEQQPNYRKSGFRPAWTNLRYEGLVPDGIDLPPGVTLVDVRTLPFGQVTAYDRRFFPEERDGFLAAWTTTPGRTALAALSEGEVRGLAVLRACRTSSRIGPLYAATPEIARALVGALAATDPSTPVAVDVPDVNPAAVRLAEQLGLTPSFETARMYTGTPPDVDHTGLFGITSLELG